MTSKGQARHRPRIIPAAFPELASEVLGCLVGNTRDPGQARGAEHTAMPGREMTTLSGFCTREEPLARSGQAGAALVQLNNSAPKRSSGERTA